MNTLRFAVAMVGLIATLAAQGDTATFDHAATGIRFKYPKQFKPIPVQPTERLVIARFQRPTPYLATKRDRGRRRVESIDVFVLKGRATTTEAADSKPSSYEELLDKQNDIHNVKELLEARFRDARFVRVGEDDDDNDPESEEWLIAPEGLQNGYVWAKPHAGGYWGVIGIADKEVFKEFRRRFRAVGESLSIPTGYQRVKKAGAEIYDGKNFRDVDFRVEARNKMVKGWKALDTENFFIVYHTNDDGLVKRIGRDLEAMRPLYMKLFAPIADIEAVSVVRICADINEYRKYGGRPGTGGYWNFVAKELVLFDYSKVLATSEKGQSVGDDKDTFLVLYHEGFHQYIFYAAGEIAPHSWFNEGIGDYFSGTVIYPDTGQVKEIGLNRWRIDVVKSYVDDAERFIPLDELIHAEQHEYYNPAKVSLMYAEGWALCYFLLRAEEATSNADWSEIIPTYYQALTEANDKFVGLLAEGASLGDRQKAQAEARASAVKEAFDGIDLEKLESAWKAWLRKTKDPWASQRGRK